MIFIWKRLPFCKFQVCLIDFSICGLEIDNGYQQLLFMLLLVMCMSVLLRGWFLKCTEVHLKQFHVHKILCMRNYYLWRPIFVTGSASFKHGELKSVMYIFFNISFTNIFTPYLYLKMMLCHFSTINFDYCYLVT